MLPSFSTETNSLTTNSIPKSDTIQNIAIKIIEEQIKLLKLENGPKERTIFFIGSKGAGKTTAINKFFDRDEQTRPTLALEYSYARKGATKSQHASQKQVLNIWELGCLENSNQLMDVPMRSHDLDNFTVFLMLDLSHLNRIWLDLDSALLNLKRSLKSLVDKEEFEKFREKALDRFGKDHVDANSLDLFPLPIVLVCGKYDIFMDFDPEIKKHVCRCLRSVAHYIGASLIFYSQKNPKLTKLLRDTVSHHGFGSPSNPIRNAQIDYNGALAISAGADSWEKIGIPPSSIDRIETEFTSEIRQVKKEAVVLQDPTKDPGFKESLIDELRQQKDEELSLLLRDSEIRGKFEKILN